MELVIALSIIFSVVALFTAKYTFEELMKLRNITEHIIDINYRLIEHIDVLEDLTKKED